MKNQITLRKNCLPRRAIRDPRRAGIATLWVVLTITTLFAFLAIVVDITFVTLAGQQLSAGADASALAGVAQVRRSESAARDQAVALALANVVNTDNIQVRRNDANAATGDVVIGIYRRADRSFTPTTGSQLPNAVRVNALRTTGSAGGQLSTLFGLSIDVERNATAMIRGDIGPGIIALHPTDPCTLDMRGTAGTFSVENGAVQVNSSHGDAACHAGQPTMEVEEVYVVGGTDKKFEDQVDLDGELITGADPIPDPLAALPEPTEPPTISPSHGNRTINGGVAVLQPGTYNRLTINGGDVTFAPGAYYFTDEVKITGGTVVMRPGRYEDVSLTGGANITMLSGLYYFTGELKVNGGNVDATAGVMLFIGQTGNLDVGGSGAFNIVGMSPTVYPNGPTVPASVRDIKVPIFQHRDNTADAELNGTPNWQMQGTVYVPEGSLLVRGTPGTFANGLIAGSIEVRGTADVSIDYIDQFPRLPRTIFLVE